MPSRVRALRLPPWMDEAVDAALDGGDFGAWARGLIERELGIEPPYDGPTYPDPAAHQRVAAALKKGKLVKPAVCSECGKPEKSKRGLHGHHDDYAKPLDVRWLCISCHRRAPSGINGVRERKSVIRSVRMTDEEVARIDAAAALEGISRNAWFVKMLEDATAKAGYPASGAGQARQAVPASSGRRPGRDSSREPASEGHAEGIVQAKSSGPDAPVMYRCRSCEFQARSPRAKCPWHPGKLVAS